MVICTLNWSIIIMYIIISMGNILIQLCIYICKLYNLDTINMVYTQE